FGIGYRTWSLSSLYSNPTRVRKVLCVTTSNGIPIGEPSQSPGPKSAWRPVETPIEAMIAAELRATGSLSTRRFHGFDFGKTAQRGAPGRPSASADGAPSASGQRRTGGRRGRIMARVSTPAAVRPKGSVSPNEVDIRYASGEPRSRTSAWMKAPCLPYTRVSAVSGTQGQGKTPPPTPGSHSGAGGPIGGAR